MISNKKQDEVINNIDGIYIVDAGAGTGKTYTITKRYLEILNRGVNPQDILLITFTRNAAINMKEKVISKADPKQQTQIIEAPILNFDSFCFKIVSKYGLNAPKILGINDNLSSYKLVTQVVIQRKIFNKFFNQFLEKNEEKYKKTLVTIFNHQDVFYLIEQMLSKGIYPTKNGWFLDSQKKIIGNFDDYLKIFNDLNESEIGKKGPKKSYLLDRISGRIKNKSFINIPENFQVENQINPQLVEEIFNDDREELLEFIHDVFIEYIEYMVKENSMTFSLISMFAFLILYNDDEIRKINSFDYIMVDEFQDTNEMQFMLILLLLRKPNLCVVGDWKQGIYGFRNASITNIIDFKSKIQIYKEQLNKSRKRISFDVLDIIPLDFDMNYRSSQKILTFSEKSLITKSNKTENIDIDNIQENIVSLKSAFDYDDCSNIDFYLAKDKDTEINCILEKIQSIVGKEKIKYFDNSTKEYKERIVEFKDIAILSRTRTFGIEIQKKAFEYNIPAVYDGGIKLFEEEPAIIILAWLKLLLYKDKREAWIPILEKENYSYLEIKYILDTKEYPKDIMEFREHLFKNKKIINYIIGEILKKYNFVGSISNALLNILNNIFNSTLMSISDLIVFIEENIENGETYNIELEGDTNSITIQTIHGSKGLEYPIVFIVNCNLSNFPSTMSNYSFLTFNEIVGIRNKKYYSLEHEFIFDNWKTDIVNTDMFSDMDEERRLLYVAITRAMYSVYFTANRPSEFFTNFVDKDIELIENTNIEKLSSLDIQESSQIKINTISSNNRTHSVHDFMTFKEGQKGRGMEFGSMIHKLAFRYIKGLPISSIDDKCLSDFNNIKSFIDNELKGGKFKSEIDCSLPVNGMLVRGIIDLVVEFDDRIEIIDWKTDLVKDNIEEYSKQLSIYYFVLNEIYPDKEIICKIFWSYSGEVDVVKVVDVFKSKGG